ncbi:UNVERIFIED_ORG: hypothetical protein ABIB52_003441 [Arthrobacter sp. UYCu721]
MTEDSWTVTGPQTIDVDHVRSLKLGMVRGRFDVVTHSDTVARVEINEVHGDPVSVTLTDGRLEVRHQLHGPQGWFKNLMGTVNHNSNNSAVISIALPAGVRWRPARSAAMASSPESAGTPGSIPSRVL